MLGKLLAGTLASMGVVLIRNDDHIMQDLHAIDLIDDRPKKKKKMVKKRIRRGGHQPHHGKNVEYYTDERGNIRRKKV